MNVINVESAARASSWEGAEEGETLPILGLVFAVLGLRLGGSAIDRGLGFVVPVRVGSEALSGDTSISSNGDSIFDAASDWGRCFEVAESGEISEAIRGTVWRRRKELVGAKGGRRAIFAAGKDGLGPQLDIGEKKGEVGLRNSLAKEDISEKQLFRDVVLCECAWL